MLRSSTRHEVEVRWTCPAMSEARSSAVSKVQVWVSRAHKILSERPPGVVLLLADTAHGCRGGRLASGSGPDRRIGPGHLRLRIPQPPGLGAPGHFVRHWPAWPGHANRHRPGERVTPTQMEVAMSPNQSRPRTSHRRQAPSPARMGRRAPGPPGRRPHRTDRPACRTAKTQHWDAVGFPEILHHRISRTGSSCALSSRDPRSSSCRRPLTEGGDLRSWITRKARC